MKNFLFILLLVSTFSQQARADKCLVGMVVGALTGTVVARAAANDSNGGAKDRDSRERLRMANVVGPLFGALAGAGLTCSGSRPNVINTIDVNRALRARGIDVHNDHVASIIAEIPETELARLSSDALVSRIASSVRSGLDSTNSPSVSNSSVFSNLAKYVPSATALPSATAASSSTGAR
jgi:hypothetical protein